MNKYKELKDKHQKEVNNFPMFFAFNNQQFIEGMQSLGLDPENTAAIYKIADTGGFYRKSDSPLLISMFNRHKQEMQKAIDDDSTGDGFIFDMFHYELCNHEYIVTKNLYETFEVLGFTLAVVNENPRLLKGLNKAIYDIRQNHNEL
jgi:hypothetical protein